LVTCWAITPAIAASHRLPAGLSLHDTSVKTWPATQSVLPQAFSAIPAAADVYTPVAHPPHLAGLAIADHRRAGPRT